MRHAALALTLLLSSSPTFAVSPAQTPVQRALGSRAPAAAPLYRDPSADVEARVDDLLRRMTLDEKLSLLSGVNGMDLKAIPRLGIPSLHMTDGPLGARVETGERATAFPAGILSASSFDPALMKDVAAAMGDEVLALGRDMLLGPCVNIARTPLGGRNFESFGEDPYLAARMAEAWVGGLQSRKVLASVKHFALNNQETRRMTIDVVAGERAIHEIYLPAFHAAVRAGAWTVMSAYNRINGAFGSANEYLLTDVLKRRWGFKGFVESDWDGTHDTVGPANAGLDVEMPGGVYFTDKLAAAVKEGKVSKSAIDDKARRVLRAMIGGGVFDRKDSERPGRAVVGGADHRALALKMAQEGIVLLKNDGILPLSRPRTIAVIGPDAGVVRAGGGSSSVPATEKIGPLEALRQRLGTDTELRYAQGAGFPEVTPIPSALLLPPAGKGDGHGLYAEFFANTELQGAPAVTRVDANVDFSFDQKSPDPKIPRENFSARWTGRLRVEKTGDYDIAARADDGVRLWVDGVRVIDAWVGEPPTTYAAHVHLLAGRDYDLKLEYFQGALGATIQLGWLAPPKPNYEAAVDAARGADAAVVFAGVNEELEGENVDRLSLDLPAGQEELIEKVAAANKNTIVVLQVGSPVSVERWLGQARAVVQAWFPGQEGALAVADVLLGRVNPSGKTPVTWPKRWEDSSAFGRYPGDETTVRYDEGLYVGYRWFDKKGLEPRFPFGFGLSYAKFAYGGASVAVKDASAESPDVEVSFDLKNDGARAGAEIAQLYVSPRTPTVERAAQELKAFERVELAPGESRRVSFHLGRDAFAYYDEASRDWRVAPGRYELRVGASSRDIRLTGQAVLK